MAGDAIALGPGKVDLLEAIGRMGSISQAAKEIKLSYKRAWDMVDTMNHCFQEPLVMSSTGGKGGGGAQLTPLGNKMILHFRSMESTAEKSTQADWYAIKRNLKQPPGSE
ncbi:DNA-binding domain of ModE / Molybdate-binding domain of ModE [hydrothermal vent metagenome]|uniref:DNA-binding domain of ModE / Molybdate-binding domain of ModE n=1 Tax=hydrothermal vent metagenome TaxID=652676 RepID=A0A3B1D7M0_9ZZZZ